MINIDREKICHNFPLKSLDHPIINQLFWAKVPKFPKKAVFCTQLREISQQMKTNIPFLRVFF
jgi:hypothetical protein